MLVRGALATAVVTRLFVRSFGLVLVLRWRGVYAHAAPVLPHRLARMSLWPPSCERRAMVFRLREAPRLNDFPSDHFCNKEEDV